MNLTINNLTTGYKTGKGEKIVSKGLNLYFENGDFVSLLGCNGGGKSTFLKTLAGFIAPLSGEIFIDNFKFETMTPAERSKMVSVVLTGRLSNMVSSVEEIVGLGRSPYTGRWGYLSPEDKRIVKDSLELVGVESLAKREISSLSDGEYQKVMIAKALAQDTPLILLDEPSAFLDFPSKVELMALLKRLATEKGKIIIQSTHDLNMALPLSTKLLLLDCRIGSAYGTKKELASSGAFAQYFSSPHLKFNPELNQFALLGV